VFFKDPLNFETHLSGGDSWRNFIDEGPGMETFTNTELSVKEFDPSLASILNFADPEAFKDFGMSIRFRRTSYCG